MEPVTVEQPEQEEEQQEAAQVEEEPVETEEAEKQEQQEEEEDEVQEEEEEEKYIPRLLDAAGFLSFKYFLEAPFFCHRQRNSPIKRSNPWARVLDCEESCLLPRGLPKDQHIVPNSHFEPGWPARTPLSGKRVLQPGDQLCSQGGGWPQILDPHQAGPTTSFTLSKILVFFK